MLGWFAVGCFIAATVFNILGQNDLGLTCTLFAFIFGTWYFLERIAQAIERL